MREFLEATRVTREDMEAFNHRDEWNVPALYIHEVQALVDQKVSEAVRMVLDVSLDPAFVSAREAFQESYDAAQKSTANVYSRRPHRSA